MRLLLLLIYERREMNNVTSYVIKSVVERERMIEFEVGGGWFSRLPRW